MINLKIPLIIKRDEIANQMKHHSESYKKLLKEYRAVNDELFDDDFVNYLGEFHNGEIVHTLENGKTIVISNAATFNGKGLRIKSKVEPVVLQFIPPSKSRIKDRESKHMLQVIEIKNSGYNGQIKLDENGYS
jgi:hypothetical protein